MAGSAIFPLSLAASSSAISPYYPPGPCPSSPLNFSLRLFFPENYVGANVCPVSGSMYVSRLGFEICQRVVFLSRHCAGKETGNREREAPSAPSRDLTNSPLLLLTRVFQLLEKSSGRINKFKFRVGDCQRLITPPLLLFSFFFPSATMFAREVLYDVSKYVEFRDAFYRGEEVDEFLFFFFSFGSSLIPNFRVRCVG